MAEEQHAGGEKQRRTGREGATAGRGRAPGRQPLLVGLDLDDELPVLHLALGARRVGEPAAQQRGDVLVILFLRDLRRGPLARVQDLGRGPSLEQRADHVVLPVVRRHVQRGLTLLCAGPGQGGVTPRPCFARLSPRTHRLARQAPGRAGIGGDRDGVVRLLEDQLLDQGDVPSRRRNHQGGEPVLLQSARGRRCQRAERAGPNSAREGDTACSVGVGSVGQG
jgi:hypothetical protein